SGRARPSPASCAPQLETTPRPAGQRRRRDGAPWECSMNCRDIARILDDGDIGQLSDADLRRARAHVAICAECAADWAIQGRVNEIAVPEMPQSLLGWRPDTARSAQANAFGARRRGRGPIVAVLLIAGAAAAMFSVYDAPEPMRV